MEIILGLVTMAVALYFLTHPAADWISKSLDGYSAEAAPTGGSHIYATYAGNHRWTSTPQNQGSSLWGYGRKQERMKTIGRSTPAQLNSTRPTRDTRAR